MTISVIIPAFNEERYLPQTLEHLHRAEEHLEAVPDRDVEIIVVDNASSDRTAEIALAAGTRVIPVPEHNIARVRNAGAGAASGGLLIFLDADTLVPEILLSRIVQVMSGLSPHAGGMINGRLCGR
ncbi:MAG: glycosyltransferase family 2 protein [Isosphaerales bacterium]